MKILKIKTKGNSLIHTQIFGAGFPIVFLHGNQQSSEAFNKQTDYFKHRYEVIHIDSRGHGHSTHGTVPFTLDLMSEDVIKVITELKLEQFYLVGFSDGANIALKVALSLPTKVSRLVLISPNIHPSAMRLYIRLPLTLFFDILSILPQHVWVKQKRDLISILIHEQAFSVDEVAKLAMPTLLIASQYDLIHQKHIRKLSRLFPAIELHWLIGIGHMRLKRSARRINTLIESFFMASEL